RPDIDDFIVLFTTCEQTGCKLTFDFFNFVVGSINDLGFFLGNYEIIDTDGRAGNRGITKARVHYLISKNNGLFQAHPSIAGVYKLRYCLLFHWLIDKLKWKTLGHYSEQQSPTDG